MKAVNEFRNSACFRCPMCKEEGETNEDKLDIRNSGIIKVWCYAASDVAQIEEGEFSDCWQYQQAVNG